MSGRGFKPLVAQKVGENPSLDGKLDEPQWQGLELLAERLHEMPALASLYQKLRGN